MHFSSASPRGGDPRLIWGNMGTLWGLCNELSALMVGEMWGLRVFKPYSRGDCGDFASVQLRGDRERFIVRSIDQ